MRCEKNVILYSTRVCELGPGSVKRVVFATRISCRAPGVTRVRARKQVLIRFNIIRFLRSILDAFVIPRSSPAFLILAIRGRNKTKRTQVYIIHARANTYMRVRMEKQRVFRNNKFIMSLLPPFGSYAITRI